MVAAETNTSNDLEVIAWQDTTTKLVKTGTPGVVQGPGLFSVAMPGLDSSRVVTADIDFSGTLSINTWTVGPAGWLSKMGQHPRETSRIRMFRSSQSAPRKWLLRINCWATRAYPRRRGLDIGADGFPTAKELIGSGPLVDQGRLRR